MPLPVVSRRSRATPHEERFTRTLESRLQTICSLNILLAMPLLSDTTRDEEKSANNHAGTSFRPLLKWDLRLSEVHAAQTPPACSPPPIHPYFSAHVQYCYLKLSAFYCRFSLFIFHFFFILLLHTLFLGTISIVDQDGRSTPNTRHRDGQACIEIAKVDPNRSTTKGMTLFPFMHSPWYRFH